MKYLAIARTTFLTNLVYERDIMVRSIFMFVVMIIFVQLWSTTFAATGVSTVDGLTVHSIVWYMVLTEAILISKPQLAIVIDAEVRGGDVAYRLSRPYSYPLYQLAAFWGEVVVRFPLSFAAGAIVAVLAVGPPRLEAITALTTLVAVACALMLVGMAEILIGLSSFWLEDTTPAQWIWNKFMLTVGGVLMPLELFPDWLEGVARLLPFAAMAYAPARVFVGGSETTLLEPMLLQVVWLAVIAMALTFVFGRATRRVVAHGG